LPSLLGVEPGEQGLQVGLHVHRFLNERRKTL
jgi:hypothetical protein